MTDDVSLEGFGLEKAPDKLPQLSKDSLENLVIAVTQAKTAEGLAIQLPLAWVLTPQIIAQLPRPRRYY